MEFPVDLIVPQLKQALHVNACVVLVAEPGAGKTTRIPLALIDEDWLAGQKIVMLEPRRLAARAAARRMAETLGEVVGHRVGYSVRLERRVSSATRIEVVTEGLLTRRLLGDPELKDVGLVIFDEFHERSIEGDFALALALDVQRGLRQDLRILVMSATLDSEGLSQHLGGAPIIKASGRKFPVEVISLAKTTRLTLVDDAVKAILRALRETKSGLLVFLPGESEIRRVEEKLLASDITGAVDVRPLYGAMGLADQDAAIRPAPPNRRKIVLATTIAETSLTIEGIDAVIDSGFKRVPRFSPATGMTALETVRVSQASAEQRRGRAGRLGPGRCYRLWPDVETKALAPQDEPEIRVVDLSGLVLDMARWGVTKAESLPWFEPPPAAAFTQAQELLQKQGALDQQGAITPHGRAMAELPLHPRLAHMVIAARELGAGRAAAEIAALLSERDAAARDDSIDLEQRLLLLRGAAKERWEKTMRQICDLAKLRDDRGKLSSGVLVALAYPDRIARRRGQRYQLSGGGGAVLPEHDALNKSQWLAIATLDAGAGDGKARLAAALSETEIERYFSALISEDTGVHWDQKANAVKAGRTRRLGAIILKETPAQHVDLAASAVAMLEGIRLMGLSVLPWSDAARAIQARVKFLRHAMPELQLPDLDDANLAATLEHWLLPHLYGMMRKSDLARLDLHAILRGQISHDMLRRMDKLAPPRLTVPGGGSYRIDYESDGDPVLRVRLQEMFGLTSMPELADGRGRLRIELLSPAGRPVAVTQSLQSFWRDVYPDVRKDMRGRYPKHAWPEDPLAATPLAPRKVR